MPRPRFEALSEDRQRALVKEYIRKIDKIRDRHPDFSIPTMTIDMPPLQAYKTYESVCRHLLVMQDVKKMEMMISDGSLILQLAIKYFVDPSFSDFLKMQQEMMKHYRASLYTIGVRNLRPAGGCSHPESQFTWMFAGTFMIYSSARFASRWITSPVADMIKNQLVETFIVPTDYGSQDSPQFDTDDPGVPDLPDDTGMGSGLVETLGSVANLVIGGSKSGEKATDRPTRPSPRATRQNRSGRHPPHTT